MANGTMKKVKRAKQRRRRRVKKGIGLVGKLRKKSRTVSVRNAVIPYKMYRGWKPRIAGSWVNRKALKTKVKGHVHRLTCSGMNRDSMNIIETNGRKATYESSRCKSRDIYF